MTAWDGPGHAPGRRSPGGRSSSTTSRSPSPASPGSTTTSGWRPSTGPAPPATTRLTPATTPCPRRCASASDDARAGGRPRRLGLPVYTLRNKVTGELKITTDPGRALVTGKWKDVGRFKGPILRGVAARAPYFHNGSAATLEDVIRFYDERFGLGLTAQEHADLVAFLAAL